MVNRPSTPEIITVNSEALQTQIRDLLPSQNGFGSELQASNVITPIIDLTAAAEGTTVPVQLQESLSFSDVTVNTINNTTTTCLNSPGFYLVEYQAALGTTNARARIQLSDGLSQKTIVDLKFGSDKGGLVANRLTVFLTAGDSLIGISSNTNTQLNITTRQIASGDGTLLNPTGYPL